MRVLWRRLLDPQMVASVITGSGERCTSLTTSAILEVRLVGCADRWQPDCTVSQENLATYFARRADLRIQGRRLLRKGQRSRGILGKKGRRESSFMSAWSSMGPRNRSECSTHKELDRHITAAAGTAGFLTAVSESGIVIDVGELIGAESLSQRLCFLAQLKARLPSLQTVVHDDACHLGLVAEANAEGPPVAMLLSTLAKIVNEYHFGHWCSEHCMPQLEANKALLQGVPTNICEIVNSEQSPIGHTIHHMGRWFCQLAVQEMVDVLNLKTLQKLKAKRTTAEKKGDRRGSREGFKTPAASHCVVMA